MNLIMFAILSLSAAQTPLATPPKVPSLPAVAGRVAGNEGRLAEVERTVRKDRAAHTGDREVVRLQLEDYKALEKGGDFVGLLPGESLETAIGRILQKAVTPGHRLIYGGGRLVLEPAPPTFADLQASAAAEATRYERAAEAKTEAAAKLAAEAQKLNGWCVTGITTAVGVVGGLIGAGAGAYITQTDRSLDVQRPLTAVGGGVGLGSGLVVAVVSNICRGI